MKPIKVGFVADFLSRTITVFQLRIVAWMQRSGIREVGATDPGFRYAASRLQSSICNNAGQAAERRRLNCQQTLLILLLGSTSMAWSATHRPQAFLDSIAGTKTEGQAIVQHYCATCHAAHPLIPLGAPRIGYASDWTERLRQEMPVLFQHTAEGFNAMPARGGCFECSDEQLKLAIAVLISSVSAKEPVKVPMTSHH